MGISKDHSTTVGVLGIFQRLRPIHRSLISIAIATILFVALPDFLSLLIKLLIGWIGFCVSYLTCCWIVIFTMPANAIKRIADVEDGSRGFVFLIILLASIASFCAVLLIIISKGDQQLSRLTVLAINILGMLFSWALVHTTFVFHYAHLFYSTVKGKRQLSFPNDETPDYMDFAYFSFVMGCTFQVSDVSITGKDLRRVALFHGLLSFALNTFVIALTVNIISSLVH